MAKDNGKFDEFLKRLKKNVNKVPPEFDSDEELANSSMQRRSQMMNDNYDSMRSSPLKSKQFSQKRTSIKLKEESQTKIG